MAKTRKRDLARTLSFLGPRKRVYFPVTLVNAIVIAVCLNGILAFVLRDVLDVTVGGASRLLVRALVAAAGAFLLGAGLVSVARYVLARCTAKTMTGIRVRVFRHLVRLPIAEFERQHGGDLVSRSTNDIRVIEGLYTREIPSLAMGIVLWFVAMASVFLLEWRLGLLGLLLGTITAGAGMAFSGPLRRASEGVQQCAGALTERLTDLLQGLPVTKMFHLEGVVHRLYARVNDDLVSAAMRQARLEAASKAVNSLLFFLLLDFGLLAAGLAMVLAGSLDVGSAVAVNYLVVNHAGYLFLYLGSFVAGTQRALAGAGRVFELLDRPVEPERYARPGAGERPSPEPAAGCRDVMVEMREVAFGYEEGSEVLRGVSLSVARGEVAALVGPSGGGKSTIVKLLMGFYPLEEGSVSIDGRPLGQIPLAQLRDLTAYVPQDAYLFAGTVEENIRYGRPGASREEVVAAARAANAHDFIEEQAEGYDTPVGERGAHLSGGQRQRIAIARALLKDAPILLLDEATSALDSESERLVQEALEVLMEGRTTIAIAHRPSTVENADVVFRLDGGRIAGTERREGEQVQVDKG